MKFYIDTSVFGGYFEKEFYEDTIPFFRLLDVRNYTVLYSDIVSDEIEKAPLEVRNLVSSLAIIERVEITEEVRVLARRYIDEGALREVDSNDAHHIAAATVASASALVSWNFKHMVNFFRKKQYNAINLREGYRIIDICTPKEVYENNEE